MDDLLINQLLGVRPSLEAAGRRRLATDLAALLDGAHAAWPALAIPNELFIAYLAERLPDDAHDAGTLAASHAADLYLACGCTLGSSAALALFERRFLSEVPGYIARISRAPAFVDEVAQQLREKLLVVSPGTRPKIADYSGRGPLAGWLRVAAVRTALNLHRDAEPGSSDAGEERMLAVLPGAATNPEMASI